LKTFFKILIITGKVLLGLIAFVLLYLGSAYVLSRIPTDREEVSSTDVDIYILSNGVHTDLVLPIRHEQMNWSEQIRFENTPAKDTTMNYVAFGWGDKGFYLDTPTWADLKASTAFKAAFSLSTSAMHATFYKQMKESDVCKKISLTKEQYARLIKYIDNSIFKDETGKAVYIVTNANYGKDDAFYEGIGSYSLFHTCNTWANDGLKSCGQTASVWTPFDTGIFYHYSKK
jgi:uncharacterized protein (TIGR02117 family)